MPKQPATTLADKQHTAPHPFGAPTAPALGVSEHFALSLGTAPITVYEARVSAVPLNRVWPGHQRPVEQTQIASFASVDLPAGATLTLRITVLATHPRFASLATDSIAVRPQEYEILYSVDRSSATITIKLSQLRHFTVEIGGQHHALHIFTNPAETSATPESQQASLPRPAQPAPNDDGNDDAGLIYFGAGYHNAGLILPRSGQTICIDKGAVVYGAILVHRADNVRITGSGILDGSPFMRGQHANAELPGGELFATGLAHGLPWENISYTGNIAAIESSNLTIEGIILRDSPLWSVNIRNGCRGVRIDNIKIIGQWRYNADGINICSSSDVQISRCFIRAFDDCIIARGTHMLGECTPLENMHVSDCVLWCDWGRALEVWSGFKNARIHNVVFENIQIIRTTHIAMDIQTWWGAANTSVSDIRFRNIAVEAHADAIPPVNEDHAASEALQQGSTATKTAWVPDLFCATLQDPGSNWQKYFSDSNQVPEKRHVLYANIVADNIRYSGPQAPLPALRIDIDPEVVELQNVSLNNICINPRR